MEQPTYLYTLEFNVRDYECDLQGVVNNAVYQNYLEHARHEFLAHIGLDFAQLHKEGIDPVVVRAEIDYKFPLKSRDKFIVKINLQTEGKLRFVFWQDIYRLPDEKIILKAKITGVCTKNGRPILPEVITSALGK